MELGIIPLDTNCQAVYYSQVIDEHTEGTTMHAVEPGKWVKLEGLCGLVVGEGPAGADRLVYVKWIPEPSERERNAKSNRRRPAFDRAFANVIPALVAASALTGIEEPMLTREEAACYAALTPSWLYHLRSEGWFGGKARDPFYATPTELDAYIAAPKATNRWQSAEVQLQQSAYKGTPASAEKPKKKAGK